MRIKHTLLGGDLRGRRDTGKPAGAPRAAGDRLPAPAPYIRASSPSNNIKGVLQPEP